MIKTAVIGATGYIGSHLIQEYRKKYTNCFGTKFNNPDDTLTFLDLRKPDLDISMLEKSGHKDVIITSAKPNIAFCEKNSSEAFKINVEGTLNLIKKLRNSSLKTIFLSSDYVFDGKKGSYDDTDYTKPNTVYGKQKKIIEDEIKKLTNNFLVLRLSKVYGLKKGDNTIFDQAANQFKKKEKIYAAKDQFFCPTLIDDLIRAIIEIQNKDLKGYINLCSPEIWSRYEMFKLLAELLNEGTQNLKKIKLYDLKGMEGRPLNTSMKSQTVNHLKLKFFPLKDALNSISKNYSNNEN
tara:strand:- start:27 stop:908 length:882 start_codon:yes stop_codon:yes gene_type:complete